MVSDNVTGSNNFPRDVRTLPHVAPNQEKSRRNAVPRKDFEQSQTVRIIGTVVIGQRNLARAPRQPSKSPPIPLPRRRHRLISRCNSSRGGNASQGKRKHEGIVNG